MVARLISLKTGHAGQGWERATEKIKRRKRSKNKPQLSRGGRRHSEAEISKRGQQRDWGAAEDGTRPQAPGLGVISALLGRLHR